MRIEINYDSVWQTSFLKENEQIDSPREFVATSKTQGQRVATITDKTIMGVLCRLIGDQRRLYQIEKSDYNYFSDLKNKVSFEIKPNICTVKELVYLTNKSESRCAQSNYMGVLPSDCPWFFSKEASHFWSILFLDMKSLLMFFLSKESCKNKVESSPKKLIAILKDISDLKSDKSTPLKDQITLEQEKNDAFKKLSEKILDVRKKEQDFIEKNKNKAFKSEKQRNSYQEKIKKFEVDIEGLSIEADKIKNQVSNIPPELITKVVELLSKKYSDQQYWENGTIKPIRLYAAALYLQAERMIAEGETINFVKNENGEIVISGFSKRGFNGIRDWLNPMSGKRKKAVGTPCVIDKQSGTVEITIDVDKLRGREIEQMIENAGVSAFCLGKKGLAYVSNIRV